MTMRGVPALLVAMLWCTGPALAAPVTIVCGVVPESLELCRSGSEAWAKARGQEVRVLAYPDSTTRARELLGDLLQSGDTRSRCARAGHRLAGDAGAASARSRPRPRGRAQQVLQRRHRQLQRRRPPGRCALVAEPRPALLPNRLAGPIRRRPAGDLGGAGDRGAYGSRGRARRGSRRLLGLSLAGTRRGGPHGQRAGMAHQPRRSWDSRHRRQRYRRRSPQRGGPGTSDIVGRYHLA